MTLINNLTVRARPSAGIACTVSKQLAATSAKVVVDLDEKMNGNTSASAIDDRAFVKL